MAHPKNYLETFGYITGESQDAFARWAVGENYPSIIISEWPENWNRLHGDVLKINGSDDIQFTLLQMVEIYEAECDKSKMQEM